MALSTRRDWIIAYDIADSRRLQRVHRFLCGEAVPIQYSVFLFTGSAAQLGRLFQGLEKLIMHAEDDVRGYPLCDGYSVENLGCGILPEGVLFSIGAGSLLAELPERSPATVK